VSCSFPINQPINYDHRNYDGRNSACDRINKREGKLSMEISVFVSIKKFVS